MPSTDEIAWAAGLFEGEGTWGVYHRSRGPSLVIQAALGMTDRDVVETFCRIVGMGTVKVRDKQRGNRKTVYVWSCGEAASVRALVEMFRPWLGERRMERGEEILRLGADIRVHNRYRTHCPKGHPLSGPNLMPYFHPKRPDRMVRKCRECTVTASREWWRKRLGTKPENYRVV